MSGNDRFGLQGDPEVREARRMQFGSESMDTLLLVLATVMGVSLTGVAVVGGWNWPGLVLMLSLPAVVWGWREWLKARRLGISGRNHGVGVVLMVSSLRYLSELLSHLQAGESVDYWNAGALIVCLLSLTFLFTQRRAS